MSKKLKWSILWISILRIEDFNESGDARGKMQNAFAEWIFFFSFSQPDLLLGLIKGMSVLSQKRLIFIFSVLYTDVWRHVYVTDELYSFCKTKLFFPLQLTSFTRLEEIQKRLFISCESFISKNKFSSLAFSLKWHWSS